MALMCQLLHRCVSYIAPILYCDLYSASLKHLQMHVSVTEQMCHLLYRCQLFQRYSSYCTRVSVVVQCVSYCTYVSAIAHMCQLLHICVSYCTYVSVIAQMCQLLHRCVNYCTNVSVIAQPQMWLATGSESITIIKYVSVSDIAASHWTDDCRCKSPCWC